MHKLHRQKILTGTALLTAAALAGCSPTSSSTSPSSLSQEETVETKEENPQAYEPLNDRQKDATSFTAEINESFYDILDFSDEQEVEFASRGLIAAPDSLVISKEDGSVIWDQDAYQFLRDSQAPATVNPSLWRNTQMNAEYGLFEVMDGIYQVRGYDLSNISFIRSDSGWIIFDCGTCRETSAAALELFESQFGDAPIKAIVISHAHIDHYGGIGGLVDQDDLADPSLSLEEQLDSGKTLVIVPDGFQQAAIEENVFAGSAMRRRSNYQYGTYLEKGPQGSLGVGIGLRTPTGTGSYYSPTFIVTEDVFEMKIDGVEMIFQLTPDTESPAEMNTYLPQYKALWMAENCTGTMHNLYTLRGAQVRDANTWAKYIMDAQALFGQDAEVIFQSHNWPHWGNDVLNTYLVNTAAVYKFIFAQTLQYINEGYTSTEIASMIHLPENLEKVWYTRQYYGTLAHNAKAVYQKYMGWYDGNPIHLNELEPSAYAQKLAEYLGDADEVIAMAREDYARGEYQWVAQITNTLVFADPDNMEARYLCADALEQLGYQAESGAWRNAYLSAAYELRNPDPEYAQNPFAGNNATAQGMSTETILDYLAICLDTEEMEDYDLTINLEITDEKTRYLLRIYHGVLLYSKEQWSDNPDAVLRTGRMGLLGIAQNNQQIMEQFIQSEEGEISITALLTSHMTEFPPYFQLIEP